MAVIKLTQAEADLLIRMEKHRVNEERHSFPYAGETLNLELQSPDKRGAFHLDITRGRIDVSKVTFQNRSRQVIILIRLDIAGPPHRNPDGQDIACPHLHLYKEGFGDKWASPVLATEFGDTSDLWKILHDFLRYCNITLPPHIERGLF